MGEITLDKKEQKIEKKYKEAFSFKDLLSDVKEFEEKLAKMKTELKRFDTELIINKDKEQKKVRDF